MNKSKSKILLEPVNQEINNQEINNQEINNQEINNQEINNQEINNQEIIRYYNIHKKYNKSVEFNILNLIKDSIKNCRSLTEYELLYIDKLTTEEKIEIIKLYNIMYSNIINLLN
jgi:hypothetical protein